jgi:hypothetical protein
MPTPTNDTQLDPYQGRKHYTIATFQGGFKLTNDYKLPKPLASYGSTTQLYIHKDLLTLESHLPYHKNKTTHLK